ncbi:las1p [Saccharomyces arboricola H-6]|uniref:Las1p n=1 Tax=Saccharomyces arboricola (strain H-6 / AS 2.3317 / CBS 10644) TaxID=1160507 RepID=J8LL86_SACAR|nr:las1p [Saccharomyces arboricola H-6]
MIPPRIVPWRTFGELEELKDWFYSKTKDTIDDKRHRAVQRVLSYQLKGSQYLPHVVDSTAQITSAVLFDEKETNAEAYRDSIPIRLSYVMALIRFVNGLLDPTQQSQFAIPLHTLAAKIGLPSWFVDLRHWGTHERDLPSLEMLRWAADEALSWLYVHYWNDEELEDGGEGSDDDENNYGYGMNEKLQRYMNTLANTFQKWKRLKNEFIGHKWMWENANDSLITSSNFSGEDLVNYDARRGKDLHEISSESMIRENLEQWQELWKLSTYHDLIVEKFLSNYDPLLLQILMLNLNNFDWKLIEWVAKNYKTQQSNNNTMTMLKKKFKVWKELQKKILDIIIGNLNNKNIKNKWQSWEKVIDENASYLILYLCQSMLTKLETEKLSGNSWRNKKRKRQLDSTMEVETKLKEYIENLTSRFNEGEIKVYDLTPGQEGVLPIKKESSPALKADTNDILGDLASLKQRVTSTGAVNKKQKRASKETTRIKNWSRVPNWEPKPFGVL